MQPSYEQAYPARIALDLHGPVVDHRLAKFQYFRDTVGVPYSNVRCTRAEIIEQFEKKGYDRSFYFASLEAFFKSEQRPGLHLAANVERFFELALPIWEVVLITTKRYNTVASVRNELKIVGLPFEGPILISADDERVNILTNHGISVYFDDKPDYIATAKVAGLLTIQINELQYRNRSAAAHFFYENWIDLLNSFTELRDAINNHNATWGQD